MNQVFYQCVVLFPHSIVFYLRLFVYFCANATPRANKSWYPVEQVLPTWFFFFSIVLAISDSSPFSLDFRNRVLSFTKTSVGIFTEITLNQCRGMHILTIFNLPIHEEGMALHLNRSPLVYLSSSYFIFTVKVLNIFVRFIPRHLLLLLFL